MDEEVLIYGCEEWSSRCNELLSSFYKLTSSARVQDYTITTSFIPHWSFYFSTHILQNPTILSHIKRFLSSNTSLSKRHIIHNPAGDALPSLPSCWVRKDYVLDMYPLGMQDFETCSQVYERLYNAIEVRLEPTTARQLLSFDIPYKGRRKETSPLS